MMTTRCKFCCHSITKRLGGIWLDGKYTSGETHDAEFSAVTDSAENRAFFQSTPSGSLHVTTAKADIFTVGKTYYLDITPVD